MGGFVFFFPLLTLLLLSSSCHLHIASTPRNLRNSLTIETSQPFSSKSLLNSLLYWNPRTPQNEQHHQSRFGRGKGAISATPSNQLIHLIVHPTASPKADPCDLPRPLATSALQYSSSSSMLTFTSPFLLVKIATIAFLPPSLLNQ